MRLQLPRLTAALIGAGAVGLPAFEQSGYFPPAWGRSALGLLLAAGIALNFRRRLVLPRLGLALLGGLTAVLLWTALSSVWSASAPRTVDEVERTIVYVAAVAAVLAAVSPATSTYLLGGALAAIVAVAAWALAQGQPTGHPLAGPLGYWNALGILAAIGVVLALGFASARLPWVARLGALASLPLLGTTLYLTHSRGALLGLGAALLLFAFLHPLLSGSRRRIAVGLVVLALAALVAGVVLAGGPTKVLGQTYGAFRSPPAAHGRHSEKLLTISGNFRSDYWRIAWRQYRGHPLLGTGSGTFDLYWMRDRNTVYGAKDAHNLYLETLAELGPIGLLLLVGTLALPFLALRGLPQEPLPAAAAAGYLAFLVHSGVDWDWELPAVTIAGLLCGGALILASGSRVARTLTRKGRRAALLALGILAAFSFLAYVGNTAERDSFDAAYRGHFVRSEERAKTATRWAPWSSTAWRLKGEAELGLGHRRAARDSYRTGLRKDPREWRLWYDLARVSKGAARKRALERAARLNPYSPEVRALLSASGIVLGPQ